MSDITYQPKVYRKQGGDEQVIASGGTQTIESGGVLDAQAGSTVKLLSATALTATSAEINKLDESNAANTGLMMRRTAKARYDFAVNGGAIGAIGLGVTLPINAIVIGGFVDVVTTCTTAGANAGTMAISVEGANDIVSAIAVSDVSNPWNAGKHAIIPKNNTPESTGIKLTVARQITATIAAQAFTAGKFNVFLDYVVSD